MALSIPSTTSQSRASGQHGMPPNAFPGVSNDRGAVGAPWGGVQELLEEVQELLVDAAGKVLRSGMLTCGLVAQLPPAAAADVYDQVRELDAVAGSLRSIITRLGSAAGDGMPDQDRRLVS
jgi:hypothetical protein